MDCIKGILIPAAWDEDGKIVSLAIATNDEQEYLIDACQRITKLVSLLRHEVVGHRHCKADREETRSFG